MKDLTLKDAKRLAEIYANILSEDMADLMTAKMFKGVF